MSGMTKHVKQHSAARQTVLKSDKDISRRGHPCRKPDPRVFVPRYQLAFHVLFLLGTHVLSEPGLLNVYGGPESIPRNGFRQPM